MWRGDRKRQWLLLVPLSVVALAIGVTFLFKSQSDRTGDSPTNYVDTRVCATCHKQTYETYQQTGMAHSFYRPRPENTIEDYQLNNQYYHRASDTYFTMI